MVDKTKFEDILITDDEGEKIILEKNVLQEGDRVTAMWDFAQQMIAINPSEGKWFEYISQWRAEGRI